MPGKVRLSILSLLALAFFVHGVAGGQTLQLFIPCSAAANTTLEGLLVGMEITSLQGDNCSWQFSYQFLQPQTDMNSLTKLSSLTLDMGINLVEDSCWTGCISNVSVSSSWNVSFNENSCSCMNKSYVFNIARTGVTPVMGQITLVDGLGERVVCSALVFSPCSSNNTINMTDLCPLHNPLGIVAPASDDCSAIGIPSSMHASAAKHPETTRSFSGSHCRHSYWGTGRSSNCRCTGRNNNRWDWLSRLEVHQPPKYNDVGRHRGFAL